MGLVILSSQPLFRVSLHRKPHNNPSRVFHSRFPKLNPISVSCRFDSFASKCLYSNADVQVEHVATSEESSVSEGLSVPIVHLKTEIIQTTESLNLITNDTYVDKLLTSLPVLTEEQQNALAAIPAHPAGLSPFDFNPHVAP